MWFPQACADELYHAALHPPWDTYTIVELVSMDHQQDQCLWSLEGTNTSLANTSVAPLGIMALGSLSLQQSCH